MSVNVSLDEPQSLVFSSHASLPSSVVLRLTVGDPGQARASLGTLMHNFISFGLPKSPRTSSTQIFLNHAGLDELKVSREQRLTLARELQQGITAPHRSRSLGDQGRHDPQRWLWKDNNCHAMVITYAENNSTAQQQAQDISTLLASGWKKQGELAVSLSEREPFGFRDGLSNPRIDIPATDGAKTKSDVVPAGDVLLGYRDVTGAIVDTSPLTKNGSYVAVRQLHQNVKEFWDFWMDHSDTDTEAIWLAAKAVGRWPNGMPVSESHPVPQPPYESGVAAGRLSFRDDLAGDDCPLGAHIRRANPRDGLSDDTKESLQISALHRMIRRGRTFGPPAPADWYPPALAADLPLPAESQEEGDRGLMFVCLCSDLSRQFEFVQQTWLNDPRHVPPYSEIDPIAAAGPDHLGQSFTVPRLPLRRRVNQTPRFVTVQGGGYFLLPARDALHRIATANWT